ncbi:MAG TPA: maleylpyruvate isomerase family mycothiol-dependent enzyme [Chloroflexota bacterium]|nr:maleylpyruvate isomerase family mycothiol-dependent enzyme [Chloroflexota bacterium]
MYPPEQAPSIAEFVRGANTAARAEAASIAQELRAGGEAAWSAPTACAGWTARDVVAHLVFGVEIFQAYTEAYLEGRASPSVTLAARAERQAALAARPREALLDELEHLTDQFARLLDAQPAAALERPVPLPFGQFPFWWMSTGRVNELALHHWDLRAPREPDARVASAALPFIVPTNLAAVPLLARGERQDGVWQLAITDMATEPRTLRVADGQVDVTAGPSADARCTLRLDGDALVRLLWGRLDLARAIDTGRVQVAGDRDHALALQRLFPGL